MGETAPTIEYATSTVADAPAVRATRFVAVVGIVVGLTGLIWTGMLWRLHVLNEDYGAAMLLILVRPQVLNFEAAVFVHMCVEGVLALVLLASSVVHLAAPRAPVAVYGMRLYAIAFIAYAVVLTGVWFAARGERIWGYEEDEFIHLASVWIPRQVHELVYAAFVLYFMRVPRRARRVEHQAEDLASG